MRGLLRGQFQVCLYWTLINLSVITGRRWREVRADSGRFVARRDQAYGSNLWCYVELSNGEPQRLLDFPLAGSRWRGCDEAWRLQMAIDAQRGAPQRFRLQEDAERR